jgi:hypothetical protein
MAVAAATAPRKDEKKNRRTQARVHRKGEWRQAAGSGLGRQGHLSWMYMGVGEPPDPALVSQLLVLGYSLRNSKMGITVVSKLLIFISETTQIGSIIAI